MLDRNTKFDIVFSKAWNSTEPDHRLKIWQALDQKREISLRFGQRKSGERISHSISHCRVLGGFATSCESVGLDIEEVSRIEPEIVAKVSGFDEYTQTTCCKWLWSAKEAALKLLKSNGRVAKMIELKIEILSEQDETLFYKTCFEDQKIYGIAALYTKAIVAICSFSKEIHTPGNVVVSNAGHQSLTLKDDLAPPH